MDEAGFERKEKWDTMSKKHPRTKYYLTDTVKTKYNSGIIKITRIILWCVYMSKKPTNCPLCSRNMRPVVMKCDLCDIEVRAEFRETHFQQLSSEDLSFLEHYLLAGFSIKALAERSNQGYTAIRSRLDRIIERYRDLYTGEKEKRNILDRVSNGEISATEAARLIEKIGKGD